MKPEDIKIDPELRDLLIPLTEEELKQLTGSIMVEGCLSPLIVDSNTGTLLDGHNRLRICTEKKIPFQIKEISIAKKERQKQFVFKNQLARRNLTPEKMDFYIVQLYRSIKAEVGFQPGDEWQGNAGGKPVRGQNDRIAESKSKAAKEVAKQVGKSEKTVRRKDKEFEAIEKAGKLQEHLEGKLSKKEKKQIIEDSKPLRKQTKAEAKEEEELLSLPENQRFNQPVKQQKEKPSDPYKRVKRIVKELKDLQLTEDEKQYIKTELEVA